MIGFGCFIRVKGFLYSPQPFGIIRSFGTVHIVDGVAPDMVGNTVTSANSHAIGCLVNLEVSLYRRQIPREVADEHFTVTAMPVFYQLHERVGTVGQ